MISLCNKAIPLFTSSALDTELQAYLKHFEQQQWLKRIEVSKTPGQIDAEAEKICSHAHIKALAQLFQMI